MMYVFPPSRMPPFRRVGTTEAISGKILSFASTSNARLPRCWKRAEFSGVARPPTVIEPVATFLFGQRAVVALAW
jgi:hypothetical protein